MLEKRSAAKPLKQSLQSVKTSLTLALSILFAVAYMLQPYAAYAQSNLNGSSPPTQLPASPEENNDLVTGKDDQYDITSDEDTGQAPDSDSPSNAIAPLNEENPQSSFDTRSNSADGSNHPSENSIADTDEQDIATASEQNVALSYAAHVSDIGWQKSVSDNEIAGTTGLSKAVEALSLSLDGAPLSDI